MQPPAMAATPKIPTPATAETPPQPSPSPETKALMHPPRAPAAPAAVSRQGSMATSAASPAPPPATLSPSERASPRASAPSPPARFPTANSAAISIPRSSDSAATEISPPAFRPQLVLGPTPSPPPLLAVVVMVDRARAVVSPPAPAGTERPPLRRHPPEPAPYQPPLMPGEARPASPSTARTGRTPRLKETATAPLDITAKASAGGWINTNQAASGLPTPTSYEAAADIIAFPQTSDVTTDLASDTNVKTAFANNAANVNALILPLMQYVAGGTGAVHT